MCERSHNRLYRNQENNTSLESDVDEESFKIMHMHVLV